MDNCTMSVTLAHGMLIYILASVFYLLRTRTIGTPFNDSLTEEQKKLSVTLLMLEEMYFILD